MRGLSPAQAFAEHQLYARPGRERDARLSKSRRTTRKSTFVLEGEPAPAFFAGARTRRRLDKRLNTEPSFPRVSSSKFASASRAGEGSPARKTESLWDSHVVE